MKLIRFHHDQTIRTGVQLEDGTRLDTSGFGEAYDEHFFETGGPNRLQAWIDKHGANAPVVPDDVRLASPISRPSKLLCVGLNYEKHAKESGATLPRRPVLFMKATSAITGPNDDLILPRGSNKTDWEVELGFVVGKRASYVDEANAMEYVAGYILHNDYSEREFQLEHDGQWVKGKSADTFAPLGPWMATTDEIENPHDLNCWLKLNGETVQDSNTSDLIFNIPQLVSKISQYMTLLPGDIVSTGTPEGVGMGMNPQRFLKPGDVVELGIDGLGSSRQHVKAPK